MRAHASAIASSLAPRVRLDDDRVQLTPEMRMNSPAKKISNGSISRKTGMAHGYLKISAASKKK